MSAWFEQVRSTVAIAGCALLSWACAGHAPLAKEAVVLNERGAQAFSVGDLVAAEARFELAVEYNERFTEAWVNRGWVALRRNEGDHASAFFRKARDLNPNLPAPHYGLGMAAALRRDLSEAERRFREALRVDPGYLPARLELGRRLFARGAFEESKDQFLKATEVNDRNVDAWVGLAESLLRLGKFRESDEVVDQARERIPTSGALALLLARQCFRKGDTDRAVRLFEDLTGAPDPEIASRAWAWIGVVRLASHDEVEAVRAARQAQKFKADDPVAAYVAKESQHRLQGAHR